MTGLFSPALALGALLSTTYAALFHLLQRGDLPTLQRYLLSAWVGFAGGHWLSAFVGVSLLRIGHLDVLSGTVGTVVALLIARSLEA